MDNNDTTYVSPLGFVIDEEELELSRKQLDEVAKLLLDFDDNEIDDEKE